MYVSSGLHTKNLHPSLFLLSKHAILINANNMLLHQGAVSLFLARYHIGFVQYQHY